MSCLSQADVNCLLNGAFIPIGVLQPFVFLSASQTLHEQNANPITTKPRVNTGATNAMNHGDLSVALSDSWIRVKLPLLRDALFLRKAQGSAISIPLESVPTLIFFN